MTGTKEMRDLCLEGIKSGLKGTPIVAANIEGNYFAGADFAFSENESLETYRIVVIRHNTVKSFT